MHNQRTRHPRKDITECLTYLEVSYIHKWVPGSIQSPYDFMLGASYVNGYRFSPHFAMGLGAGLNYYFDNEQITAPIYLHLNADILYYPQVRIKFGVEF